MMDTKKEIERSEAMLAEGQALQAVAELAGLPVLDDEVAFALVNAILSYGDGPRATEIVLSLPNQPWAKYLHARVCFESDDWLTLKAMDPEAAGTYSELVTGMQRYVAAAESRASEAKWYSPDVPTQLSTQDGEWRGASDMRRLRQAVASNMATNRPEALAAAEALSRTSQLAADQLPIARLQLDSKQYAAADVSFEKALDLSRRSLRLYLYRIRLLWHLGRGKEALDLADQAREVGVGAKEINAICAGYLLRGGKFFEAVKCLAS